MAPVVCLYQVQSEIRSATNVSISPRNLSDKQAVIAKLDAIVDRLSAVRALDILSIDTHDAHDNSRNALRPNIGMSGSEYSLKYMYAHPEENKALIGLYRKLDNCEKPGDGQRSEQNRDGVSEISSSHQFKLAFRPHFVFMDEPATVHELTFLTAIANNDPLAWITSGDVVQNTPFMTLEHDLDNAITSNPFAVQYQQSTLARAVEGGHVASRLNFNMRA
ncbi:hypothetical protein ACHAPJ_006990 [Fusarium lateritium]